MVPYRIEGIDTPIYAKRYVIQAPYFAESSVEIIAECSKNEKATGNNDCYFLDLFLRESHPSEDLSELFHYRLTGSWRNSLPELLLAGWTRSHSVGRH